MARPSPHRLGLGFVCFGSAYLLEVFVVGFSSIRD